MSAAALLAASVSLGTASVSLAADEPNRGSELSVPRLTAPVRIDGNLSDPAWKDAARVTTFYEINVADSGPPPVPTAAYIAYDDEALYLAFDCSDPDPRSLRAYYSERDNVFSEQDFVGVILDTRHDGRSALELFINAYGIVDDGWVNDATGREDFSPDLFWDTAGKIDERGWTVEARIPFSSLRYRTSDGQTKMGIIFYRNYPREYRFQMFSVPLPRNANCFVCRSTTLTGFTGLPLGHHLVVAPYGSVSVLGSQQPDGSWRDGPTVGRGGADIKWVPNADTAVDLALNPDFSQVESDTAQLTVNQRFALFYDEKRPFFLEGADLFDTPVQAVYTRTITEPRWGARATGKVGRTTYTALVADDRGGGSVIIPGPQASDLAPSDFETVTGIARVRSDFGRSYAGLLATVRRNDDDVGSGNRVIGPDFQWRPSDAAQLTAQYLYSQSRTPDRPDLAEEWDGRRLEGGALYVEYAYTKPALEFELIGRDVGEGFRADAGFVPRAGYRQGEGYIGFPFYLEGFFSRFVPAFLGQQAWDREGDDLGRLLRPFVWFRGRGSLNGEIGYLDETVRVEDRMLERRLAAWELSAAPSRILSRVWFAGRWGQEIDVANVREGDGVTLELGGTARIGRRLSVQLDAAREWLDVPPGGQGGSARLFTADADRLRMLYAFSARAYVRAIAQYVSVRRDPSLYLDPVPAEEGGLDSSLLFSYQLNWQSVLFVGWGDERALEDTGDASPDPYQWTRTGRRFFLKVSYAFQ